MDLKLKDKVVLITGASGGIGRAMAEAFAGEGARIALHGHRQWDALRDWTATQSWSENAHCVHADITDPGQVDAAFDEIVDRWGRMDVCVANAGIWPPEHQTAGELSEERVRSVIEVNLLGAMWTARAFGRTLQRTGPRPDGHGASLIFTGSTAGRFGEAGHADYAASKAGVVGLARSLKNELVEHDPYARVNVIEPGWTVTPMTRREVEEPGLVSKVVRTMPIRQLARAEDIARTALWLASSAAARHVSGQMITVAGGMEGRVLWEGDDVDTSALMERLEPDA